jgi:hypothetical protein
MNSPYDFYFYIICKFARKVNRTNTLYYFSAVVFLSVCLGLNVITIFYFVEKVNKIIILNTFYSLLIGFAALAVNCYFFLWKHRYKKIIEFYDKVYENKKINVTNIFFVLMYIIITLFLCGYVGNLPR